MAHITEHHLHEMARRHHATMKKLDFLQEKISKHGGRLLGTIETGAGSWLGGAIEGKTGGGTMLSIPINLGVGAILLAVGHFGSDYLGKWSGHVANVGNGFINSYVAASGYAFGKRWKESGQVFGGGGHPWTRPYENGWNRQVEAPVVHGNLDEAQMAAIVARMQAAAAAPAQP